MSVLKLPLLFTGDRGDKRLDTLFDSGANLSCINPSHLPDLGTAIGLGRIRRVATASDSHFIEISQRILLDFYIEDVLLSDEFLVVPNLSEEVIIGAATMQKWRIKLDFEHDAVHVDPKVAKMQLKKSEAALTAQGY
ncbi:MAG: hypothetical protein JO301_05190 [Chitinophagaceae bacterium]|nr:hypothetical protein [Chitinophagaceae bacterium]